MTWKRVIDEKPTKEFRDKVFQAASAELGKLRESESVSWFSWPRRFAIAGGVCAVFGLILYRLQVGKPVNNYATLPPPPEPEVLANLDMFSRMEMLEDLDILEDWHKGEENG